jgi:hypothetical protein
LNVIAAEIRQDWGMRINGAAAPFVEGLGEVRTARDRWYAQTGADAIRGFLMNAQTWRGEVAGASNWN